MIKGSGEDTLLRTLRGRIAPVHKPLISAAAVRKKKNHIWIGPDGSGAIVPSTHAAAWYLRAAEKAMSRSPGSCTWLYEEAGVYNFYLRTPKTAAKKAAEDLSTVAPEMRNTQEAGAAAAGAAAAGRAAIAPGMRNTQGAEAAAVATVGGASSSGGTRRAPRL